MTSSLLTKVRCWCDRHLKVVMGEIYDRNSERARRELGVVRERAASEDFTPDERQALELFLLRIEYFINRIKAFPTGLSELFDATCDALGEAAPGGPAATVMYHRVMLELMIAADRDGVQPLGETGFHRHFDQVPAVERDASFWYVVSSWLFDNGRVELLKEAYEVLLTNPMSLKQFPMRRIRLMYLLAGGTVHPDDIHQFVSSLTLQNAFNEFKYCFMPVIREQGLATPDLEELIAQTEARFANAPPGNPYDD